MNKYNILKTIKSNGIIAVIRGESEVDAINTVKSIVKGGICSIELTFTTPYAHDVIKELSKLFKNFNNVVIGAGTVLNEVTAQIAIFNGAKFIVSPIFDKNIAKVCNLYSIPYFPGCLSPSEIVEAMKYGCNIIKLFPAKLTKASYIDDIKGPLTNVEFIPSGGVNLDNLQEWINKKCFAISIGGYLTNNKKEKGYDSVVENTIEFVNKFKNSI